MGEWSCCSSGAKSLLKCRFDAVVMRSCWAAVAGGSPNGFHWRFPAEDAAAEGAAADADTEGVVGTGRLGYRFSRVTLPADIRNGSGVPAPDIRQVQSICTK